MSAYRNPMPGLTLGVAANAGLTYSTTIVELGGVYEVARWAGGPSSFTAIDGLLSFRYWNDVVDLKLDVNGAGLSDNGVNVVLHGPIIGLTVRF